MSGSGPGSASRTRGAVAEEGGERRRILDRRREPDPAQPGREALQPREAEHQLVAALRFGERVDLVDDDPARRRPKMRGASG